MTRFEKVIVMVMYIGQLLFVPAAMWALTQPTLQLEMHRWARPIGWALVPINLLAVIFLFHDLWKRQFEHKKAWVIAILLTGVAIIPYTFLHAFRPRTEHARV